MNQEKQRSEVKARKKQRVLVNRQMKVQKTNLKARKECQIL